MWPIAKALAMLCAALWGFILIAPVAPHAGNDGRFRSVCDPCIVDYPEYWELMHDGEVTVEQNGLTVNLVKDELGWLYLQELGTMVRTE